MNHSEITYLSEMPPITLLLEEIKPASTAWHSSLQLLYVIEGFCHFTLRGISYHILQHQIAIISPMDIYMITEGSGSAALLRLDTSLIEKYCPNFQFPTLKSMLLTQEERTAYQNVTAILESIVRTSLITDNRLLPLQHMTNALKLTAALIDYCSLENQRVSTVSQELPVLKAIEFTNTHFREDITIQEAADIAQYSVAYFSKLFSRIAGTSYMKYVTQLRMQEAEKLLSQGISINDIASRCGFPDYRAFTRAYRQKHGKNPSNIRKYTPQNPTHPIPVALSVTGTNLLTRFMGSLNTENTLPVRQEYLELPDVSLNHFKQTPREFTHSWSQTIGLGQASLLLQARYQEHIRQLQNRLPYKRAVIHGLLDDEMQILQTDAQGHICFSFIILRTILDFLRSVHLNPVIELGHMPSALARDSQLRIHNGKSCISLPKNLEEWCQLVETLLHFLFSIYGQNTVETWEFCLWGKPETSFWDFERYDFDDYFQFYHRTYLTVKKMSRRLHFASPAFLAFPLQETWLNRFFDSCKKNNCLPDSLRFAFYPVYVPEKNFCPGSHQALLRPTNPDLLQKTLYQIDEYCQRIRLPYEKIELAEWNFSISQREYLSDTCFMASYITKNILDCHFLAADISYWAYNDDLGELSLSTDTFYGGSGLCTVNGIKKPSYYAFELLSRLGSSLLAQGEGYAITQKGQDIQILFYNYCHYSVLYAKGENFNESFSNRYDAFLEQKNLHCSLLLTDLPAKRYLCTTRMLNREHGSAFDRWIDMGMITIITQEELEYITGTSVPQMTVRIIFPENGSLRLTRELLPFEVCLIELHVI